MYLFYCNIQRLYNHLIIAGVYVLLTSVSPEDHADLADEPCKNSIFLSRRIHHLKTSCHSYLQNNCKLFCLEQPIIPRQGLLELY